MTPTQTKYLIAGSAVVIAFASGRYLTPTKIKIEKQVVEVEKKSDTTKTDQHVHKEITQKEVVKPDGTKTSETKTVEDDGSQVRSTSNDSTYTAEKDTKTVTRSGSLTMLSVLYGTQVPGLSTVYGGSLTKEVLGPLSLGIWGLSSGQIGFSIGVGL